MECPIVTTCLGQVKGITLLKANHEDAKQVFGYLGIPFAKPPLGNLRFKAPEKAEPWEGVLDANKSPPVPMNSDFMLKHTLPFIATPYLPNEDLNNMSEDCLYLNVYTSNPEGKARLPVLFWLYGGAFSVGSAIGFNGQALCGLNDVVLVVPQYRLNVFGFYSLGKESSCKGNMGLQDQIMAMKWVKDNIRNFGGDPDNVTILGNSAGAMSIGFHVMSSESRGLFHKAISHSGPVTLSTMLHEDLSTQRNALHEHLKISATDHEEILKKLREFDAKDIIDAFTANYDTAYFTPTVDRCVIAKHPSELIKEGNFAPVPYIIGVNNSETCGFLVPALYLPPTFAEGIDKESCVNAIKNILTNIAPAKKIEELVKAILDTLNEEYDENDPFKWSKILGSVLRDTFFFISSIEQASAHSGAGNPTYFYYMTQQLKMHHDTDYSGTAKLKPIFCEADHADDMTFTFGFPFMNCKFTHEGIKFSENEKQLSKAWMKILCRFAETGNPNSDTDNGDDLQWPQYDSEKKRHLIMKWPFVVDSDSLTSHLKLWLETVPGILTKE